MLTPPHQLPEVLTRQTFPDTPRCAPMSTPCVIGPTGMKQN
jgi:hypothetical protein